MADTPGKQSPDKPAKSRKRKLNDKLDLAMQLAMAEEEGKIPSKKGKGEAKTSRPAKKGRPDFGKLLKEVEAAKLKPPMAAPVRVHTGTDRTELVKPQAEPSDIPAAKLEGQPGRFRQTKVYNPAMGGYEVPQPPANLRAPERAIKDLLAANPRMSTPAVLAMAGLRPGRPGEADMWRLTSGISQPTQAGPATPTRARLATGQPASVTPLMKALAGPLPDISEQLSPPQMSFGRPANAANAFDPTPRGVSLSNVESAIGPLAPVRTGRNITPPTEDLMALANPMAKVPLGIQAQGALQSLGSMRTIQAKPISEQVTLLPLKTPVDRPPRLPRSPTNDANDALFARGLGPPPFNGKYTNNADLPFDEARQFNGNPLLKPVPTGPSSVAPPQLSQLAPVRSMVKSTQPPTVNIGQATLNRPKAISSGPVGSTINMTEESPAHWASKPSAKWGAALAGAGLGAGAAMLVDYLGNDAIESNLSPEMKQLREQSQAEQYQAGQLQAAKHPLISALSMYQPEVELSMFGAGMADEATGRTSPQILGDKFNLKDQSAINAISARVPKPEPSQAGNLQKLLANYRSQPESGTPLANLPLDLTSLPAPDSLKPKFKKSSGLSGKALLAALAGKLDGIVPDDGFSKPDPEYLNSLKTIRNKKLIE